MDPTSPSWLLPVVGISGVYGASLLARGEHALVIALFGVTLLALVVGESLKNQHNSPEPEKVLK